MKITELKRSIEAYPEKRLQLLVAEMYKAMPKKLIEEKNIDRLVLHTYETLEEQKKAKKSAEFPDFDSLTGETETFIQHAYRQNYYASNKEIPKKDRPKWRFIVKRLTDQLVAAGRQPEYAAKASSLLDQLYVMLCQASDSYLFNTDDPFNSVRIAQPDYFRYVLTLKADSKQPQVWVREAIQLIANEGTDRFTLPETLIEAALEFLHTVPHKEIAVEQCDRLLKELEAEETVQPRSAWGSDYRLKETRNCLQLMQFFCRIRLHEYDLAIGEFKRTYMYSDSPEVELYVLLQYLYSFDLKDYWLREYEAAVNNGIEPRKQLRRVYRCIGETGRFPESYYS